MYCFERHKWLYREAVEQYHSVICNSIIAFPHHFLWSVYPFWRCVYGGFVIICVYVGIQRIILHMTKQSSREMQGIGISVLLIHRHRKQVIIHIFSTTAMDKKSTAWCDLSRLVKNDHYR